MNRAVRLLAATILLTPSLAGAETLRGTLVGELTAASGQQSPPTLIGINDLLGVSLGDESRFFKGIEIHVAIPNEVRRYRDLLALFVYTDIRPKLSPSVTVYRGRQVGFAVLPRSPTAFVNIPIAGNTIEPSVETITLPEAVDEAQFPIIIAVLPLEKGIPDSIVSSEFAVTVTPILKNEGLLKLAIAEGGKEPVHSFTLSIDGQPEPFPKEGGYLLETGLHHLRISSDYYVEQYQTFGIEQSKTTSITLKLVHPVPKLVFEAPDLASVYLDGKLLSPLPREPLVVTEGSHVILFKVGNYTLTKTISVEKGKTYKISLLLDISVQEN